VVSAVIVVLIQCLRCFGLADACKAFTSFSILH
jgi:hypothetical protein